MAFFRGSQWIFAKLRNDSRLQSSILSLVNCEKRSNNQNLNISYTTQVNPTTRVPPWQVGQGHRDQSGPQSLGQGTHEEIQMDHKEGIQGCQSGRVRVGAVILQIVLKYSAYKEFQLIIFQCNMVV